MSLIPRTIGLVLLIMSFAISYADKALLFGIGRYDYDPNLRESGCLTDTNLIDKEFKRAKFKTDLTPQKGLTDTEILAKLDEFVEHETSEPREAVVLYFSCLGTSDDRGRAICPSNFEPNKGLQNHAIYLNSLVAKLKPLTDLHFPVTVILDCAFGGPSTNETPDPNVNIAEPVDSTGNSTDSAPQFLARYAYQVQSKGNDAVPDPLTDPSPVCFFSAGRQNECASATLKPDGHYSGVFTQTLVEVIRKNHESPITWQEALTLSANRFEEIQKQANISEADRQQAHLTPGFASQPMFGSLTEAPPAFQPPQNVLDYFALDAPNKSQFQVSLNPLLASYCPGQQIDIGIGAKRDGFLIMMSRQGARYRRVFPTGSTSKESISSLVLQCRIHPDAPHNFQIWIDDSEGDDLKILWIRDQEVAKDLITHLPDSSEDGLSFDQIGSKDVNISTATEASAAYYTFDRHLRSKDGVIGFGQVVDRQAVIQKLTQGLLGSSLRISAKKYLAKVLRPMDPAPISLLVNALLVSPTILLNANLSELSIPSQLIQERDDLRNRSEQESNKVLDLNLRILQSVFPTEIDWKKQFP
jgi:Caspase domain